MKKVMIFIPLFFIFGFTKPPKNTENICQLFQNNPTWYSKAKQTELKWGIPIPVQMAIINQESHFNGEAKANSSAYGFSQALRKTWTNYQKSTGAKGRRNEFAATTDFIGWYLNKTKHYLGISSKNTYALYLAYHEGLGGYRSHSYAHKPSIMRLAKKVDKKAEIYQTQLVACEDLLPTFLPFG